MSNPIDIAALRKHYEAIAKRLGQQPTGREREEVKKSIIGLFKTVDSAITDLSGLKESIRVLVDDYKKLAQSQSDDQEPQISGPIIHADHLGASTFIEKGWNLMNLGDYSGAIQATKRALELSPGNVQAETQLGSAQMKNGDHDEALATFQQVLLKEPANSMARVNVGYICLKKRIFGEAIEHLSKAIRLDNNQKATLYAHFYLGLVYSEREMFEDAQTFFEKTIDRAPMMIEAYFHLGRTKWLAGDREGGKDVWSRGVKANALAPWGERCQEMLDLIANGKEPVLSS